MPKVFLAITTWKGTPFAGEHYYGRLRLPNRQKVDVEYTIRSKQVASSLNGRDFYGGYAVGSTSTRFFSRKALIAAAKKQVRALFPEGIVVLIEGESFWADVQPVLLGPPAFIRYTNRLLRQIEKLGGLEGDRAGVQHLSEEWNQALEALVGKE